jgi:uncharacterized protein YecE (DUF72 family)
MAAAYLGTSGFGYKEWRPIFYPEKLSEKKFLGYYASRFNAVEIDYTFYRMPNPKILDAWQAATPETFRFTLKAAQKITHRERLTLPSEANVYLVEMVRRLGARLGVLLYQLPPFLRADPAKLDAFLATLPRDLPVAFEFRHDSWFTDETYRLLEKHGVALCINDGDEASTPQKITAKRTYLRLRRTAYDDAQRDAWKARIRAWVAEGIDVFAFIKHMDNPNAPLIALDFADGLATPAAK